LIMEGRMVGIRVPGRPRSKTMDWMMDKSAKWNYNELKNMAQDRRQWQLWSPGPV